MMVEDIERETTPPHHPTYGVHLGEDAIQGLMHVCLPELSSNLMISMLPHGQSFSRYPLGHGMNLEHELNMPNNVRQQDLLCQR